MRRNYAVSIFLFLILAFTANTAHATTVVLNFDSVSLSPCCGPGSITDATAYLASYGVTFTPLTPNTLPAIQNSVSSPVFPSSLPNLFTLYGATGPQAVSYELNFSTPLDSISFTRAGVASNVGIVGWIATALDAEGNVVATASEPFSIGAGAEIYTFVGAGIRELRIDARNDLQRTTLNAPDLDNLTLVSSVPEPQSFFLLALGLVGLLVVKLKNGLPGLQ